MGVRNIAQRFNIFTKMKEPHLGFQKTIDFYGCNSERINSCEFVEKALLEATGFINLTVVNTTIHSFSPIGVSGVIVIQESHIAIHTWPEHDYVAIDIFTCNQAYKLDRGITHLKEAFQATHIEQHDIERGRLSAIDRFKIKEDAL